MSMTLSRNRTATAAVWVFYDYSQQYSTWFSLTVGGLLGIFVGPAGIALVRGAPAPELARAFIDELLGKEMQDILLPETFAFPSNVDAKPPEGLPPGIKTYGLDWQFVARERQAWVQRWDREMAI